MFEAFEAFGASERSRQGSGPREPSRPEPKPKHKRRRRRGVPLGRRPREERRGFVSHAAREEHLARHPVHVSMKRERLAPSLRSERVYAVILRQLRWAKGQGVRVVHYSVQHDHLHLVVEGRNKEDLSDQMRRLFSRLARAVNSVVGRRGRLFRDRHHRRELRTPTETRNALVYVLFNERKHEAQHGLLSEKELSWVDDRTSAAWVEGWAENARPPPETLARMRAGLCMKAGAAAAPALATRPSPRSEARASAEEWRDAPVSKPRTWLAERGWFERGGRGRLKLHEMPRFG